MLHQEMNLLTAEQWGIWNLPRVDASQGGNILFYLPTGQAGPPTADKLKTAFGLSAEGRRIRTINIADILRNELLFSLLHLYVIMRFTFAKPHQHKEYFRFQSKFLFVLNELFFAISISLSTSFLNNAQWNRRLSFSFQLFPSCSL